MMVCPLLQNPIIFVPGLFGFDTLSSLRQKRKQYFPGISDYFKQSGNLIHFAHLHPTRSIHDRATQLKNILKEKFPHQAVHLIGHSLGGLDSRYLISKLKMASQVLSLTTIGTPHRGSSFADWGVDRIGRIIKPFLQYLKISYDAFDDLTRLACQRFNETVLDHPAVRYFSVAGYCEGRLLGPEWWFPAKIVRESEGKNDGIVSLTSACYGEWNEIWEGDHLNLINWPNRHAKKTGDWRDRSADYGRLLNHMVSLGY